MKDSYQDNCTLPHWGKSESYNALISYYIGVGETNKAKKQLTKALKIFPNDYMLNKTKDKIE